MLKRKKPPFTAEQLQPKWEELVRLERRLRRNRKLSRLLQPIGLSLCALTVLLSVLNFSRCIELDAVTEALQTVPLLFELTEHFPHASFGGCLGFLCWFGLGIPVAVCAAITAVVCLLDRRKAQPARPLKGSPTQQARAVTNQAETVYMLRGEIKYRAPFALAGGLTALTAVPIVLCLLQVVAAGEPSFLRLAGVLTALLLCLFVLYWVYAGLLTLFSLLLSTAWLSPSEWSLYEQYCRLDAYRKKTESARGGQPVAEDAP